MQGGKRGNDDDGAYFLEPLSSLGVNIYKCIEI